MARMKPENLEPVLRFTAEVSRPEYNNETWIYMYEYKRRKPKGIIILDPESGRFYITLGLAINLFKKAPYPSGRSG